MTVSPFSPYAPPAEPAEERRTFHRPGSWKATTAAVAILASVASEVLVTALDLVLGGDSRTGTVILAIATVSNNVTALAAGVFFLIWVHDAAANARRFGQVGLEYTPGWCVGWWFVPIASLFKPYAALKEVWKASDPSVIGAGPAAWMSVRIPTLFPLWWGTYLFGSLLGGVAALSSLGDRGAEGPGNLPLSLVAHASTAVAAVSIVIIMQRLGQRQSECGRLLIAQ